MTQAKLLADPDLPKEENAGGLDSRRDMRFSSSYDVRRIALALAPVLALALAAMPLAQAQTYTVLYTFTGGTDGSAPLSTPILYNGTVYGTAAAGGTQGNGTVYGLVFKSRKEIVLHSFTGGPTDGGDPIGGLVQDSSGNFYGVAYKGGAKNDGTLFKLTPAGSFTLLHSFAGPPAEGIGPAGTLVFDPLGALFGTTYVGGKTTGWGTVFEYSAAGTFKTGQSFSPDGALPKAGLLYESGKLYGTTSGGDAHQYGGTIYQVGVQTALYTFSGGADGSQPLGRLLGDGEGNVYGTTSAGGTGNFGLGWGVVFKYNLASGQETVLHTFTGPDGGVPAAGLTWDSQGNLYGTTTLGGAYGYGNVFEIDPAGNLTSLHDFTGGADGATHTRACLWTPKETCGAPPPPEAQATAPSS